MRVLFIGMLLIFGCNPEQKKRNEQLDAVKNKTIEDRTSDKFISEFCYKGFLYAQYGLGRWAYAFPVMVTSDMVARCPQ